MALAYTPPGVTVDELSSPSINPLLSVPASICLVGVARGYELKTTQVTFNGASADPGSFTVPVGGSLVAVDGSNHFVTLVDAVNPAGSALAEGTDYTVDVTNQVVTITPVTGVGSFFHSNTTPIIVSIVYRYLLDNYYEATRLDSLARIEEQYGPAYSADGASIGTQISYAAALAFENGAQSVVLQPLFKLNGSVKGAPSDGDVANATTWATTLLNLRDIEDINILVPIIGQSFSGVGDSTLHTIHTKFQDHCKFMLDQGQYVLAIYAEDSVGSTTNAAKQLLRDHADDLTSRYGGVLAQQSVFLSPARFSRSLPIDNTKTIQIGGQYVAAAVAGMLASRSVTAPLTRKQVSGVTSVLEVRNKTDKNLDASHGLTVIENKGAVVQVRHSITLDNRDSAHRELSVVRGKFRMVESVTQTIDAALPIIADGNALAVLKSLVIGTLEELRSDHTIVNYNNVAARILSNDPTTAEVRFSYQPAFPLNYVHIAFSIDMTSSEVTTVTPGA